MCVSCLFVVLAVSTAAAGTGGMNISRRFFAEKGEDRVAGRLDGLLMTRAQVDEETRKHYDEEGNYRPPPPSAFPSMSRRDIMMNVRIPPLGIVPPPFGEDQIKEVSSFYILETTCIAQIRTSLSLCLVSL